MPIKYGSCSGTATPRLVPGLYRYAAVLGKGERQTGRVAHPLRARRAFQRFAQVAGQYVGRPVQIRVCVGPHNAANIR